MADKKLNISADLKVKTTDAERVLQKLAKEGTKVSQILKGLDINTNQGRGGFAKSLTTASKEMLKLRGTTQDTAKVMEHVYGRQLERQTKNLDKYTKKIEDLNKKFKFQQAGFASASAGGNAAGAAVVAGRMDNTANKILVAEAARQATKAAIQELKGGNGGGSNGIDWDRFRGAMGGAKAFGSGLASGASSIQTMKTVEANNIARIRDFERNMLARMAGGDFSDLYYANRRTQSGKFAGRFAMDEFGGTKAGKATLAGQAMGQAADVALGVAGMAGRGARGGGGAGGGGITNDISNVGQGAGQIGSAIGGTMLTVNNAMSGGAQKLEQQTVQAGYNDLKQQTPLTEAALSFIQNTAAMRVGAAKSLQGRHMGAWGIGMGHGLDMGESFALAQGLSRQFGVGATMGTGGSRQVRDTSGFKDRMGAAANLTGGPMSYNQWSQSGANVDAMFAGPKMKTVSGPSLMGSTLGLERMGIDRATAGGALGTMQQAAGGDLAKANKALEDVMTKAFGRGLHDARLGEEIVKATGDAAFGFGGKAEDMGAFGMMLSGGLNKGSTLRDVQANVSGFNAVSGLFQGNDYFRTVKAEAAHNILGAGGTGTQMMAASKSSLGELIRGSEMLSAAGVSKDQRMQMFNQSANTLMGAFLTNTNDKSTAGLREALGGNGGNIVGALQGKGNKGGELNKQFALALSSSSDINFEDAMGFARDLQGFGSTADTGKGRNNYKKNGDGVAEGTVRSQQAVLNELFKEEIRIRKDYLAAIGNNSPAKIAEAIGKNDPSVEAFQKFMDEFLKIMKDAFEKSRGSGGRLSPRAVP